MSFVKIIPKTRRAKNRVHEHGEVMNLKRKGSWAGEPAILVESLDDTFNVKELDRKEKWWGWLTETEADHIVVEV